MITLLALSLLAPAFADDTQTTDTGGQELVNAIGSLYAAQQAAEERLAAAEAELARRKACCKAKPAPKATEPAPAPAPTITVEPIEPPAPVADPEIEQVKAEAAAAKAAYEAAKAQYDLAVAALQPPTVNVTVSPTSPTVMQTERTVVEVRSSGFHPILYVGGAGILAGPVPDVSGFISGRIVLGFRYTWDLDNDHAFGLMIEGGRAVGSWGVRGIPTYLAYGSTGGWGVGVGAAYNCDVLTDEGCLAEHTGGLGRLSWEKGGKVAGVLLTGDVEVNYLTIPGAGAIEARGVLGAHVYFGNAHPKTVTFE